MQAYEGVPRVAVAALGLRGDHGRGRTAAGQGPLGEGVRGQYPPVAAQARRQHQIGEADESRVVLDERGLGLLDVDDRSGGGGGARGDIL
uniref:Uncharacterized protein n=1 Tax=Streptomyces avermitilis TaxID=33903 RepID=A0A499W0K3_STRAX|nr:hypothetical protein SAVMC3_68180 [Streptomyces avermitilis]